MRKSRVVAVCAVLSAMGIFTPAATAFANTPNTVHPNTVCQVVGPASTAAGGVTPAENGPTLYRTTQSASYIANKSDRVYGQAGGTLTYSRSYTRTVTATASTSVTGTVKAVFASASASVGVSISGSKSVTATVSYSWKVPSSQSTGWIEMGAHGYNISYRVGHYKSPCTWVQTSSGTVKGTTSQAQFKHS